MLFTCFGYVLFGLLFPVHVVFRKILLVHVYFEHIFCKRIKLILKKYNDQVILRQTSCFVIDPSTIFVVLTIKLHFLPARAHI